MRHVYYGLFLIALCTLVDSFGSPSYYKSRHLQRSSDGRRQSARTSRAPLCAVQNENSNQDVVRIPLETAGEELRERLAQDNTQQHVQIEGYVTAVRMFGPSFGFVDLSTRGQVVPVEVICKRQEYNRKNTTTPLNSFAGCMKCLVPGVKVRVSGPPSPTRHTSEAILVLDDMELMGLPTNPQHARIVLQAAADGLVDLSQVARAAHRSVESLQAELQASDQLSENAFKARYYSLAKKIVAEVPEDEQFPHDIIGGAGKTEMDLSLPLVPPEIQVAPSHLEKQDALTFTEGNPVSVQETRAKSVGGQMVFLTGWVQNRRRFRGSIAVLEVVDQLVRSDPVDSVRSNEESDSAMVAKSNHQRIKCVLHPQITMMTKQAADGPVNTKEQQQTTKMLGNLLAPGSNIGLEGWLEEREEPNVDPGSKDVVSQVETERSLLLWVTRVHLLRASWRPSVVRLLIDCVIQQDFDTDEAAQAMRLSNQAMDKILETTSGTERQWKAVEISRSLEDAESRMGTVTPQMLDAVKQASVMAREQYPIQAVPAHTVLPVGIVDSRWKRKKEPQLEWMTRQVELALRAHPDFGSRRLQILDIGGGQGFLANHLAEHLHDSVEIQVVDIAHSAIRNGTTRSNRRKLGVTYTVGDASTKLFGDVDVVVALHACGALTDVALGQAAMNEAAFVICPCCFRSNPHLLVPLAPADDLTDKPSSISVEEFLGVEIETYDVLKRVAEVQGDMALASEAIHSICALRATAFQRRSTRPLNIEVKTFPIALSTRNFCLVGSHTPATTTSQTTPQLPE